MVKFRVIDPHGDVVATDAFDTAEAAYPWFIGLIAGSSELGWRMEVDDEGRWAFFDDTEGFTAPSSQRRAETARRQRD
jgi:hypothetical protein